MNGPGPGPVPEPFDGEILRAFETSRAEKVRATTAVMRRVVEGRYRDEILAALFQPPRPALPPHGASRTQEYAEARTAWLDRCRAWLLEQGRVPYSRQISDSDQRLYVSATGDAFVPPEVS